MEQAHRARPRNAARAGKEPSPCLDSPPHHAPTELSQLNSLPVRQPVRKAAQIRWLWPEIGAALVSGHTIIEVRQVLALDGLEISYSKLRTYVARLRNLTRTGSPPTATQSLRRHARQTHRRAARPRPSHRRIPPPKPPKPHPTIHWRICATA
jgi:hypothetical protein